MSGEVVVTGAVRSPVAGVRRWAAPLDRPRARWRRALVLLLAMASLAPMSAAPVMASPVVVLDTLATATPASTFSVFGSGGQVVSSEWFTGPRFSVGERTRITEIGGFLNVCATFVDYKPQCPATRPFVVEIRRSVNGLPDPAGSLASVSLSHDDDPLTVSYESAVPNVWLEPGDYFALVGAQASDAGMWLTYSVAPWVPLTTTLGFVNVITGRTQAYDVPLGARILGDTAPRPTSKAQCKDGGWRTLKSPPFENQGDCVASVAAGGRKRR